MANETAFFSHRWLKKWYTLAATPDRAASWSLLVRSPGLEDAASDAARPHPGMRTSTPSRPFGTHSLVLAMRLPRP